MFHMKAVSLFSSGGIADLALKKLAVEVIVANELLEDRVRIFCRNFPESEMLHGDISERKADIIKSALSKLAGEELDFLLATPPENLWVT